MNFLLVIAALLLSSVSCKAQPDLNRGEFAVNSNGLMYSDKDMAALRFIVDSLNLRFKTCDLNQTYYSHFQTRVYYVSFESKTDDLTKIINQIKSKKDFIEIVTSFTSYISKLDTNRLLIRIPERDEKQKYYYLEGTPGEGYDNLYWDGENESGSFDTNEWLYDYSKKDKDSEEYSLTCRYFPRPWSQTAVPADYGRLIQYVDCMIDTTATIFLTDKYSGGWSYKEKKQSFHNLKELADYIDSKMYQTKDNRRLKGLSESQVSFAVKELQNDAAFRDLLSKTIDDYVKNKTPEHDLEFLADTLKIYDKALLMKRCYRVMGSCSQDSRPREHARDIAILAAQAHSWDIFLRAHLDIMNDRFERATDGSYAWHRRKTYLKELEELNLNIVDLMLGLSLRAQNVAGNHYYGTIWRLGWALAESKEKNLFEEKAISIFRDDTLDEFNRGLIFLLYKTYLQYLKKEEAKQKIALLQGQINSFPRFIRASIQNLHLPQSEE